jgi:hypothetical protein
MVQSDENAALYLWEHQVPESRIHAFEVPPARKKSQDFFASLLSPQGSLSKENDYDPSSYNVMIE